MPTANILGLHVTTSGLKKRGRLYNPFVRISKPKRLVEQTTEWWHYMGPAQAAAYGFAILGGILTIVTAVTTGQNQLLLALIAVIAQFVAAFFFSTHGRAHPSHAKRAFSRLLRLAERVRDAEQKAQKSFEDPDITIEERHTQIGILSTELSWMGDGIYEAAQDWVVFNESLNEMVSESQRAAMLMAAREERSNSGRVDAAYGFVLAEEGNDDDRA